MPYHHGDLRRALLDTALEAITEHGPATVSLRDVARRAGVSHAAPTHHFRDKAGLLTAVAVEGWGQLADALGETAASSPRSALDNSILLRDAQPGTSPRWTTAPIQQRYRHARPPCDAPTWTPLATDGVVQDPPGFAELGVTYVLFATSHPAHFAVMRSPGLVRADDPELQAAQSRAGAYLQAGAERHDGGATADPRTTALAAWSLVHGLSALLLEGTVEPEPGVDVATLARSITGRLRP